MANYEALFRSNYFRVKDPEAFAAWCQHRGLELITDDAERVGFLNLNNEAGIPSWEYGEEGDEGNEIDLACELSQHLQEGEVAVVVEVGWEKMRYLIGHAFAVNAKGDRVGVSLDDIYQKARDAFGATPSDASY